MNCPHFYYFILLKISSFLLSLYMRYRLTDMGRSMWRSCKFLSVAKSWSELPCRNILPRMMSISFTPSYTTMYTFCKIIPVFLLYLTLFCKFSVRFERKKTSARSLLNIPDKIRAIMHLLEELRIGLSPAVASFFCLLVLVLDCKSARKYIF